MLSLQIQSARFHGTGDCSSPDRIKGFHHSSSISQPCVLSKLPPLSTQFHLSQFEPKPISNKHHEAFHHPEDRISPSVTHIPSNNPANSRDRLCRPQPPALFSKPKRKRISPEQFSVLSSVFECNDTPSFDLRETTAAQLGMSNREVQVWFQNRRAKMGRHKSTSLETCPALESVPSRSFEAFSSTATRVSPDYSTSRLGQARNHHSAPPTNTHDVSFFNKSVEPRPEDHYPVRSARTLPPQNMAPLPHIRPHMIPEGPAEHIQGIPTRPYREFSTLGGEEDDEAKRRYDLDYRTWRGPHRGTHSSRSRSTSCSQSRPDYMNRGGTASTGSLNDEYDEAYLSSLSRSVSPSINGSVHHGQRAREESVSATSDVAHTSSSTAPYSITRLFGHGSQPYRIPPRPHSSTSRSVTSFASEFPASMPTSSYGSSGSGSEVSVDRKSHVSSLLDARHLPPLPLQQPAGPGSFPIHHRSHQDQKVEFDRSLTLPPLVSAIAADTSTQQLCQAFNRLPSLKGNIDASLQPRPIINPPRNT